MLTSDLLDQFEDSIRPVNTARLLPPEIYTSDEFFDFERRAVFFREWLCLGRVDQIREPGDYHTTELAGEPLIMIRDRDGTVRVLSAVCQHRGMVLLEGSGSTSRITCPYHHWTYGLDGALLGTPAMDRAVDFDRSCVHLPRLRVEVWQGFVFANFDEDARPLARSLRKIDALLDRYDLNTTTTVEGKTLEGLAWNWKVMLENFNDPYHASRLHGPLQSFAPSHLNEFLPWDDDDGAIARIQSFTHENGSFNPSKRAILPVFKRLEAQDRIRGFFIIIPPTLALAVVPDEVAYFIVNPVSAGEIALQIGYCFEPAALEDPMFEYLFAAAEAGVDNFNIQDIHADEMTQRGLRSVFAPRGRYSWQEETLQQFNRWLVRRYRESWPD